MAIKTVATSDGKEYEDLKKQKTYLKMVKLSKKMHKTNIKAKDIYETSKKELEERGYG